MILLYYYTIILLYYYTIILLYSYTIILLYYYTIILLYYYTIILLYYYTIILLYIMIILIYNLFDNQFLLLENNRYDDSPNDLALTNFSVDVDLTTKLPLTWMVQNISKIKLFSSVCFLSLLPSFLFFFFFFLI